MRAYKNDSGLVDVFYCEPDETMTVEEFEVKKQEWERQRKIDEHLAALKELGYVFETNAIAAEEKKVDAGEAAEVAPVSVAVPTSTSTRVKRW